MHFQLTPVYGVTIPVIVRLGNLRRRPGSATSSSKRRTAIAWFRLDLSRAGERSTFGEVRVLKAGVKDPIAVQRAVAVYTEIGKRRVDDPAQRRVQGRARGTGHRPISSKPTTTART